MRKWLIGLGVAVAVLGGAGLYVYGATQWDWFARTRGAGEIAGASLPPTVISDRAERVSDAAGALGVEGESRILFGDLHVHTTFSTDAFMWALRDLQSDFQKIIKIILVSFYYIRSR